MVKRFLLPAATAAVLFGASSAQAQFFFGPPGVVVVREPGPPKYYDPYYNRDKVWVPAPVVYKPQPQFYKTTDTKKHGNKVTKTTKIRNQFGQVVYENKTTTEKKKKKK